MVIMAQLNYIFLNLKKILNNHNEKYLRYNNFIRVVENY